MFLSIGGIPIYSLTKFLHSQMNKLYISSLFLLKLTFILGQTALLDPTTHPKFQNAVPFPTRINLSATTTNVFEMAQKTQWLGLVNSANTPLQTKVWGYGTVGAPSYPAPTLVANSGVPVNVEWRNNLPTTHLLPVDNTYHKAAPTSGVPAVVHLHGGHVEAASDGNTEAWYTSGYAQKGPNFVKNIYTYDNSQEGATLWFHDHTLGMTRLNVYAGLAGFYLLNDANDQALSLPRGNYDRELVFQDRKFDATGQLFYPSDVPAGSTAPSPSGQPEFFGDFNLVNGIVWPFMNVEPRKYRLRLLNGSDSRVYTFALSNGASFFQISTDDGKLNTPSVKTQLTLAPGERADVIINFAGLSGQTITLLNSGPDGPFGNPTSPASDPATTGQVMQFKVNQTLNTTIPDVTLTATTNLRPTLGTIPTLATQNKTRKVALFEGVDEFSRIMPMLGIVDPTNANNGSLLWHDPVTETVNLNDIETWEVYNTTADAHPVHLHLVSFQVLSKQTFTSTVTGKPQLMHNGAMGMGSVLSNIVLTGTATNFAPNDNGWKDTYVVQPGEMVRLKAKFDRAGEYVWHCHILSHEDHDMMRKLVVIPPSSAGCSPDVVAPVLTACPTNITRSTTTTCTAVAWTDPSVTDNCSTPTLSFTTRPTAGLNNGDCFPIGTTTVTYMAMDAVNNMSTCQFTVTVNNTNPCTSDITPPVFTNCPKSPISLTTTTTCATATWATLAATDNCSTATITQTAGQASGSCFPIGTTSVSFKAVDAKLNTSTCSFVVTVVNNNPCTNDVTPPMFHTCPSNITVAATSTCATVSWTAPSAMDNCVTPSVSYTTSPTANLTNGGCFPVGTTTVTYIAKDAKGNSATCSFTITVTPPPCKQGLTGAYFSNSYLLGTPTVTRIDPTVNFDWGWGSPSSNMFFDLFSVRWTGQIKAPVSGNYTFYLDADDGARVWINNKLGIDKWSSLSIFNSSTYTVYLNAGQNYPFKMEYFESLLGARAKLYWSYPGVAKQTIPTAYLCSSTTATFSVDNAVLTIEAAADYNRAKIQWVNNTGNNNDYFVLQRQNPQTGEFEDIKTVNNTLKNTDMQYFTEYDEVPSVGDNFYRVKLVLNDGSMAFTDIAKVTFKAINTVSIFPNPAQSELNIDVSNYTDGHASVYIYNSLGQLIQSVQNHHHHSTSSALITFDVSNMVSGTYLVRIVAAGKKDFVKQVSITQ